jgi:hypothetical protein
MSNLLVLASDPTEVAQVVEEARNEVRYVVTDFSLELIASKFRDEAEAEGDIYVPSYQRSLAWSDAQGSYFIESLILRIPVPPLFLYDVEGRLEIVDGSQRVRSLVRFLNGDYALAGLEKIEVLNGYRYADLPPRVQRRLNNTPIRSFVMDQGTDESTRIELFRRLNTSGKRLEDAEIRKGIYQGPFLDLVVDCAASDLFKTITPHMAKGVDARSERQELVTRFFIYSDFYMEFRHDVRKFLDEKMDQFNESSTPSRLKKMRREFDLALSFVRSNYPNAFYRSDGGRRVPRVRFEAVAVGTNLALRAKPKLECKNVNWLRTPEFEELVRTDASNSAPKLRSRIEYVRDHLLGTRSVR